MNFKFNFNLNQSPANTDHIVFSPVKTNFFGTFMHDHKHETSNGLYSINLKTCISDILKDMPKTFIISTNNNSYNFNIDFLKDSCSTISNLLKQNPDALQYHIDIDDQQNVMSEFEQLFEGKVISFVSDQSSVVIQITKELGLTNCPDSMKCLPHKTFSFSQKSLPEAIAIDQSKLYLFFKNTLPKSFTIILENKEYKCTSFGVLQSKVIYDQIQKDPKTDHFVYHYSNSKNEFDIICKLFNFEDVSISVNNINLLKKISEDLQIQYLLDEIKNISEKYEYQLKLIDKQKIILDLYDKIFYNLYHINELSAETVKNSILQSYWVQSGDNIYELAACILQVVNVDYLYQQNLAKLLILLDKESNDTNNLKMLKPFILKHLLFLLGTTNQNCSFLYILSKNGYVSIDSILDRFMSLILYQKSPVNLHNNFIPWFFTELQKLRNLNEKQILNKLSSERSKFINSYMDTGNIEGYMTMRDKGEPDDELTNAIRNDDIEKLKENLKENSPFQSIPFNIFDGFAEMNCVNYAAFCGSVNCFKYLLQSVKVMTNHILENAISSGKKEIILIFEDHMKNKTNNQNSSTNFLNRPSNFNIWSNTWEEIRSSGQSKSIFSPAIVKHNNELLDWIWEDRIAEKDKNVTLIAKLASVAAINGNAHSFIKFMNIGNEKSLLFTNNYINFIQEAFMNGFYKISEVISLSINSSIKQKIISSISNDFYLNSVRFGSLSIFKLAIEMTSFNFSSFHTENIIDLVIEHDYVNIFKYIKEKVAKNRLSLDDVFRKAVRFKAIEIFKISMESVSSSQINLFSMISFTNDNIEIVKLMTDLIIKENPQFNFTQTFINSAKSGSDKVCQFFIDKKVYLNYFEIAESLANFIGRSEQIVFLLIDVIPPEIKNDFLGGAMKSAIESNNTNLVKLILESRVPKDQDLFNAVKQRNEEMVDMILQRNSDPFFVNKLSDKGTALNIASNFGDVKIVKRLLSIPGINPSLYSRMSMTPLTEAFSKGHIEVINAIFDFYGESIKNEKHQIRELLRLIMKQLPESKEKDEVKKTFDVGSILPPSSKDINDELSMFKFDFKCLSSNSNENEKDKVNKDGLSNDDMYRVIERLIKIDEIDLNFFYGSNSDSLLMFACTENKVDLLKKLLTVRNLNVNMYSPLNGNTPLIAAIEQKNSEIAEILLRFSKTEINHRNYKKQTALTIAVSSKLDNIVNLIISHEKFNPIESNIDEAFFYASGQIATQLWSIKNLNVNSLLVPYKCIKKNKNIMEHKSCLMDAVMNKDFEKVDLIISHPSFDPNKSLLKSAIFKLGKTSDVQLFRKLLKLLNSDVNIHNKKNESLLTHFAKNHNEKITEEIVNNENFDEQKNDILTSFMKAFHKAAYNDQSVICDQNSFIKVMEILANYDKEHNHLIDFQKLLSDGKSYFTSIPTRYLDNANLINFFLDHGVDPDAPDKFDEYPLEFAIKSGSLKFVQTLLSRGKIDLTRKIGPNKQNYLRYALSCSQKNIIDEIIKANPSDLNSVDENGDTVLIEAVKLQKIDIIEDLFKYDDLDYLHQNNDGLNALDVAMMPNNKKSAVNKIDVKDLSKEQFCQKILSTFKVKYKITVNTNTGAMPGFLTPFNLI